MVDSCGLYTEVLLHVVELTAGKCLNHQKFFYFYHLHANIRSMYVRGNSPLCHCAAGIDIMGNTERRKNKTVQKLKWNEVRR